MAIANDYQFEDQTYQLEDILAPIETGDGLTGEKPSSNESTNPLAIMKENANQAKRFLREAKRLQDARDPADRDKIAQLSVDAQSRWRKVAATGLRLISREWKDLATLAKVTQALIHLDQAKGLSFGYTAATRWVTEFWEAFVARWQQAEQGKLEDIVTDNLETFSKLNHESLASALRRAPVDSVGTPYYQAFDLFRLENRIKTPLSDNDLMDDGKVKQRDKQKAQVEEFRRRIDDTPSEFYIALVHHLTSGLAATEEFRQVISAQFKAAQLQVEPPNTSQLDEAMQDVLRFIREVASNKLPIQEEVAEVRPSGETSSENDGTNHEARTPLHGDPRSREEAFRQLEAIAEYFRQSEPQSLIPSQIRDIVRQGKLSPEKYFEELIGDTGVREKLFRLVGLNPDQ